MRTWENCEPNTWQGKVSLGRKGRPSPRRVQIWKRMTVASDWAHLSLSLRSFSLRFLIFNFQIGVLGLILNYLFRVAIIWNNCNLRGCLWYVWFFSPSFQFLYTGDFYAAKICIFIFYYWVFLYKMKLVNWNYFCVELLKYMYTFAILIIENLFFEERVREKVLITLWHFVILLFCCRSSLHQGQSESTDKN